MATLLNDLGNYSKANKKLVNYYNSISNNHSYTLDVFDLLQNDIRYCYGVFLDFFFHYGIIMDVNRYGYSLYLVDITIQDKFPYPPFFYSRFDGNTYIARKYTTLRNYKVPKSTFQSKRVIQYNMRKAILDGMTFLNI